MLVIGLSLDEFSMRSHDLLALALVLLLKVEELLPEHLIVLKQSLYVIF